MGVIFYFSSLPAKKVPSFPDFIPHFIEYFILGILVFLTLREHLIKRPNLLASFWCFFYALTDEFHQLYVPGRQATLKDWLVDAAGALTGVLLVGYLSGRLLNKEKERLKDRPQE
jgi:VanZ family protein